MTNGNGRINDLWRFDLLIRTLKPAGTHRSWPEPIVTTVLSRNPPDVCRDSGMRYQLVIFGPIHARIGPFRRPRPAAWALKEYRGQHQDGEPTVLACQL
jgi:hypothetical protein